jgi:hypothetical protein
MKNRIRTLQLLVSVVFCSQLYSEAISPDAYRQLHFRYIGPVGNRVSAVVGVTGNPLIYYAGSASGGIFKTTDGGTTWNAIFDDQPVSSIGALAVAPSDPNIVWAGTGEPWIRSHISIGMGIYKSSDAGKTWMSMGLEKTGRIARVVIDPRNPNVVYAAAMGHNYGPQPNRGLFCTRDGGKTWEQISVGQELTRQIRALRSRLSEIMSNDVAGFNNLLKQRGIQSLQ